jgi:hypothetical protein
MFGIKVEARVACIVGPINVKVEANIGIARSTIETNPETTPKSADAMVVEPNQ